VIPINGASWQPWARRRRQWYLCARCFWTSWHQVDLRLVPDQVLPPPGTVLMLSASIIVGEAVAPVSPAEVPTTSVACGGVLALASATGGEVTTPSTAPRGGVAVRASSASASPTTCGSGDLVREGDGWATGTSCGLTTGLHDKAPRQDETQIRSTNTTPDFRILPRHR
jgi:hypothetical protein